MGARNCGYLTVEYSVASFVQSLQLLFRDEPCPLCGTVHPPQIHSYPNRSYRDPESMEVVWIRIPVIICRAAQQRGLQYTKRMLPDFLIPYARIRLDRAVEATREKEGGADLECCSRILGCLDLATVRRHLKRLAESAAKLALLFAEKQAAAPHLSESNQELRPLPVFKRLEALYLQEQASLLRAGRSETTVPSLRYFLQTVLWQNRGKVLMSFPSRAPPNSCYTY